MPLRAAPNWRRVLMKDGLRLSNLRRSSSAQIAKLSGQSSSLARDTLSSYQILKRLTLTYQMNLAVLDQNLGG